MVVRHLTYEEYAFKKYFDGDVIGFCLHFLLKENKTSYQFKCLTFIKKNKSFERYRKLLKYNALNKIQ